MSHVEGDKQRNPHQAEAKRLQTAGYKAPARGRGTTDTQRQYQPPPREGRSSLSQRGCRFNLQLIGLLHKLACTRLWKHSVFRKHRSDTNLFAAAAAAATGDSELCYKAGCGVLLPSRRAPKGTKQGGTRSGIAEAPDGSTPISPAARQQMDPHLPSPCQRCSPWSEGTRRPPLRVAAGVSLGETPLQDLTPPRPRLKAPQGLRAPREGAGTERCKEHPREAQSLSNSSLEIKLILSPSCLPTQVPLPAPQIPQLPHVLEKVKDPVTYCNKYLFGH